MRIALAQILSGTDPAANLTTVEDYTRRAADDGARLVVFPEAHDVPVRRRRWRRIAEPLDGPVGRRGAPHRGTGRHHRASPGMFCPSGDGRVTNTLIAAGPDADTHYDKIHLYDAFGFTESRTVAPGHEPVTDQRRRRRGRVDHLLRHPLPRALHRAGPARRAADHRQRVVGVGPGKLEQWTLLARARALDSAGFVAAGRSGLPR